MADTPKRALGAAIAFVLSTTPAWAAPAVDTATDHLLATTIVGLIGMAVSGLVFWLGARYSLSEPQKFPFLGGGEPQTHAWQRYHARYYPMALLFIAFEMEMMFMYPWAVVYVREGMKALMEMGMFLGILSLGILYAWREGALRWQ